MVGRGRCKISRRVRLGRTQLLATVPGPLRVALCGGGSGGKGTFQGSTPASEGGGYSCSLLFSSHDIALSSSSTFLLICLQSVSRPIPLSQFFQLAQFTFTCNAGHSVRLGFSIAKYHFQTSVRMHSLRFLRDDSVVLCYLRLSFLCLCVCILFSNSKNN